MSETDLESATNIGLAIEDICGQLPNGWEVHVELERNSAGILLFDDRGERRDFPCNYESLSEELRDALEYARRAVGPNPEVGEAGGLANKEA